LAHFIKRVDFETVASVSSVSVVSDGKSEADLIWLALIELRGALADAGAAVPATRPGAAPLTVILGPGAKPPPLGQTLNGAVSTPSERKARA
jgi:hypothetical protein